MLVDSTGTGTAGVTGAIREAAGTTGASFRYLLATAQIESGLNPKVKAPTSSATGLFQFIDQTWLATMKDAGASLGYGKYSAAITRTKSGRLFVKDPAMRAEIMGLRKDPTANALMAGAFTKQNAATLRGKIGREPTEAELYMAHFLGAGGATKLINAAAQNPDAKATSLLPRAAHSNNSLFYDKQGRARTTSQVYAALVHKLDVARAKTDSVAQTATAATVAAPSLIAPVAASIATSASPTQGITATALIPSSPVRTVSYLPPDASGDVAPAPTVPAAVSTDTSAAADTSAQADASAAPTAFTDSSAASRALLYAPDSPVFYDLFRTDDRQAVSSVVTELWGAPPRASSSDAAVTPTSDAVAQPPNATPSVAPANNSSAPAAPAASPASAPLDLFNGSLRQRPRFDRRS